VFEGGKAQRAFSKACLKGPMQPFRDGFDLLNCLAVALSQNPELHVVEVSVLLRVLSPEVDYVEAVCTTLIQWPDRKCNYLATDRIKAMVLPIPSHLANPNVT